MRTPASIVGGAIVPMGFVLKEKVGEETQLTTALRRAYTLFAVASFTSQLISVVYSSIAVNKLAGACGSLKNCSSLCTACAFPHAVLVPFRDWGCADQERLRASQRHDVPTSMDRCALCSRHAERKSMIVC
eukprot:6205734-Pleurochrysis_carterae.AAC.3